MRTRFTRSRSRRTCRWTHTALIACGGLFIAACQSPEPPKDAATTPKAFTIHIDRGNNGAVEGTGNKREDRSKTLPRVLAFEMSGAAPMPPANAETDQHAAARQAAVIEAFASALIEARRSRGQSTADFSAQMGPRLTVCHQSLEQGRMIEVRLNARGVETVFAVRNGVLQHPPHDLRSVQELFAETNGEFSLLETGTAGSSDQYVATVACYLPRVMDAALAGGTSRDETAPSGGGP